MWNVFTADKYTGVAFSLRRHFASSFCGGRTGTDLKVQSSNSNTKVSRGQVHSLSVGGEPERAHRSTR